MINRAELRKLGLILSLAEEERVATAAQALLTESWEQHRVEFGSGPGIMPAIKPFMVRFVLQAIEHTVGRVEIQPK